MNIPQLPTDSLYKFITMSGLVLTVLSLTYLVLSRHDLALKVAEGEGVIKNAEVERQNLEAMKISPTTPPKDEYEQARLARFFDLVSESRRLHERNVVFLEQYLELRPWVFISLLFGVVLFAGGSWLWYMRLQRYQDLIVQAESRQRSE